MALSKYRQYLKDRSMFRFSVSNTKLIVPKLVQFWLGNVICLVALSIAITPSNANSISSTNLIVNSMVLSASEIQQQIQSLPNWTTDGEKITRTFQFKDFVESIEFVNQLVAPAEAAGHHPDIEISYNQVVVSLTTHDAGGITQLDFDLAAEINQLAK